MPVIYSLGICSNVTRFTKLGRTIGVEWVDVVRRDSSVISSPTTGGVWEWKM